MSQAFLYPSAELDLEPQFYELAPPNVTLGRHPNNTIVLLVESVSRYHAKLQDAGAKWTVEDVGSSNGTFVNGERVTDPYAVKEGDVITLGRADFTFSFLKPQEYTAAGRAGQEVHTSSVNIVTDEPGTSTILSTQLSTDSTPFKTAGIPESRDDVAALQKMTKRLMTLYKLSDILRAATNQDEVVNSVMDLIFEVLPADRGVILTIDSPTEELEPLIVRFRDPSYSEELSISRTIVQKSLDERVAILSRDVRVDSRFAASESILASDVRSAMCVPLVSKRSIIGVLFLDSKESVRAFSEDDLNFASSLGNEVAMTLDNLALAQENIHNERLAAVGQTIAGLAHNIKNILQLARGGIELMDGAIKRKATEDIESFWPVVRRGIDRMQSLTQEMLDYSRHTAPELVSVDVNVVLTDLAQSFRQDQVEPGVDVLVELAPELPERRIDPDSLNKAIMNLLSNAVDAFDGTGGKIVISTHAVRQTIFIRVQDDGKGIPKDKQLKIFQPFFTTKGSKGTGLGLSMSRKYVEDMGGTMSLESEEGRGTTFTITLPPLHSTVEMDPSTSGSHRQARGF
ncbi:MAG: ATP-binding protein [Candidatus Sumerlaeaceae bacterium]